MHTKSCADVSACDTVDFLQDCFLLFVCLFAFELKLNLTLALYLYYWQRIFIKKFKGRKRAKREIVLSLRNRRKRNTKNMATNAQPHRREAKESRKTSLRSAALLLIESVLISLFLFLSFSSTYESTLPSPASSSSVYLPSAVHQSMKSIFTFAIAGATTDVTSTQECNQLKDLDSNININDLISNLDGNPNEPEYGFKKEGYYFCGADSPPYLSCKCGISSVCYERLDPWGRDLGECGCCTSWVIILFAIFAVIIVTVLVGGLYACMCHGTWLYDGYPQPITPLLPQRSATIIAPASFPLPEHAFRPYRSSDFISSDDPAAIAGAIAAAALEPPGTADGVRRRRRQNQNRNGQPHTHLTQSTQATTGPSSPTTTGNVRPPTSSNGATIGTNGNAYETLTPEEMAAAARTVAARHRSNVTVHMPAAVSESNTTNNNTVVGGASGIPPSLSGGGIRRPPPTGQNASQGGTATDGVPPPARRGELFDDEDDVNRRGPALPLNSAPSSAGSGNNVSTSRQTPQSGQQTEAQRREGGDRQRYSARSSDVELVGISGREGGGVGVGNGRRTFSAANSDDERVGATVDDPENDPSL